MLTFTNTEDKQNGCFKLLGMAKSNNEETTRLISNNVSLLSAVNYNISSNGDTCSFYSGPTDATIMAFGESMETCGSIAYSSGSSESCGSVAYSSGGFTSGSSSCSSSSSGGCCSYCC